MRVTRMTRSLRLAGLALFVALSMGCHSVSHEVAKQQAEERWNHVRARVKFQLAEQHYRRGLFDEVAVVVSESLALDPRQADAYVLLARAQLELSRPASAEQAVDAARRAGVDCADLHYTAGVILEQRDQLEDAIQEYARALALAPGHVDALMAQAECLVALDRAPQALELLDANADRFDDGDMVTILGAHIAVRMGDLEGAIERYGRASEALKRDRVVAEEWGLLLAQAGRCHEAVDVLRALVDSPDDVHESGATHRALARCFLVLGDPLSAQRVLADYAPSHPDDPIAQLLLSKAAVETGDLLTAAYAVDLARRQDPHNPEVALLTATIEWRRGFHGAAAETLYQLLEHDPDDVDGLCLLAEVLRTQGQTDTALDCFERASRIAPASTWANAGRRSLSGDSRISR